MPLAIMHYQGQWPDEILAQTATPLTQSPGYEHKGPLWHETFPQILILHTTMS